MRKIYTLFILSFIACYCFSSSPGFPRQSSYHFIKASYPHQFSDSGSLTQPAISIFPNPVKSSATISFTYQHVDKISILNIVGKEMRVYIPEPWEKDIKINLIDLQPGIYFLSASYKGETLVTKKFMKDK